MIAEILSTKAAALAGVGRLPEAEDAVRHSLRQFERVGDTVQLSMANIELGDVLLAQERLPKLRRPFAKVWISFNNLLSFPLAPSFLSCASLPSTQKNDVAAAEELGREALSLIERFRDELPDSKSVEQSLRQLMDDASNRRAAAV